MPEVTVGIRYIIENMSELQQQFGQIAEQAQQIASGPSAAGVGPSVPSPLPPHSSSPTPWGPRSSDEEIGMFPGMRGTMPPYAGGASAPPMGSGNGAVSSIVIQTVNTLTISHVGNLSIAGVGAGAGAGGGGAAVGAGGAAGAGAPSAFDPNQTIMPGDWPPGASVPAANAGGSAQTGGKAAAGARRMRFGMYSTPYQFNQWAYQELQDAQASGDPYRYADAFQQYQRSQQHLQNIQNAQQPNQPPSLLGALGGLAKGIGVYGAISAGTGMVGQAIEYRQAGGDITQNRALAQAVMSIPILGGLVAPMIGPQMEKEEMMRGIFSSLSYLRMPTDQLLNQKGELNSDLSPMYAQSLMRMGQSGYQLPAEMRRAFAQPEGSPYYLREQVRAMILGAYQPQRESLAAAGTYRYDETPSMQEMGGLAFARGDYQNAFYLSSFYTGTGTERMRQDRDSLMRAQNLNEIADRERQAVAAQRNATVAYGINRFDQTRLVQQYGEEAGQIGGQMTNLFQTQAIYQGRLDEARSAGRNAEAAELQKRVAETSAQFDALRTQQSQTATSAAQVPLTTGVRSELSKTAFTIDVLQNIPGAYGNIRGAYLGQIGALEKATNEVFQMHQVAMQQPGYHAGGEADLMYQERMQDLMRQQAGAFQAASYGWEGRIIQQAINAPANFNMVVSRFSLMDAVTRANIRHPHMGSTMGNLPAFMRFAGILNWPSLPFGGQTGGPMGVPGIPGMGGDAGAAMPGQGPPDFFPPGAGNGGTPPTGATPGRGGGFPPGAAAQFPVLPSDPGGGGGPGAAPSAPSASGGAGAPHSPSSYSHDPPVRSANSGAAGRRKHPPAGPPHHRADKMQPGETYEDYVRRRNAELGIPTFAAGPETVVHQGAPGRQWLGGAPEAGDVDKYGAGYYQRGLHPAPHETVHPAPPGGGGRGAHGSGPPVGAASGAATAGASPPVNITVNISLDGKQIQSKTVSGAAGAASVVQNGLAQGGADDMIAQMGYSTARQG